jgi:Domain of Unknown Function (DUF748)
VRAKTLTRRSFISIGIVLFILIGARIALPYFIRDYVDKTLDSIPGYYGYIEDVDVALWRGAYSLNKIGLVKTNGKEDEPLFSADAIEIALDWSALLQMRVVSRVHLAHPQLQFIQRKTKESSQTSVDQSWQQKVNKLIPLQINQLRVTDGLVRYKDETKAPKINLYFSDLAIQATNISNATRKKENLPSSVELSALLLKSGKVSLDGHADFLAEPMEANIRAKIRALDLKELNEFTKAYGGFDFEKGRFDLTTELAATNKDYSGYVKTIAREIDVLDFTKERKQGDSVVQLLWEGMVGVIMEIFQNQRKDQFAARIPISGPRDKMAFGSWEAVGSILSNAFVKALSPKFEDAPEVKKNGDAPKGTPPSKEADALTK